MKSRRSSVHPFVGHTKMDALLREVPWAATSIGVPEKWPGTWRAAARLCLDSSFPMVLLLGEEFLFVYNDVVIPIVGGKHPDIVAQPTGTAWGEIWAEHIEPMVAQVMRTGEPQRSDDL